MHDTSVERAPNMADDEDGRGVVDGSPDSGILGDLDRRFGDCSEGDSAIDSDEEPREKSRENCSLADLLSKCRIGDPDDGAKRSERKSETTKLRIAVPGGGRRHKKKTGDDRKNRNRDDRLVDDLSRLRIESDRDKKEPSNPSRVILVERGPVKRESFPQRTVFFPYQNRQLVNRNGLCGGKVLQKEEPLLDDLIPTTVIDGNNIHVDILTGDQCVKQHGDRDASTDLELATIMEIIHNQQSEERPNGEEDEARKMKLLDIVEYLSQSSILPPLDSDDGGDKNEDAPYSDRGESNYSIVNETSYSISEPNASPQGYSPVSGFYSPLAASPENLVYSDGFHSHDSSNNLSIPSVSGESFGSISSSDSPGYRFCDDTFVFHSDATQEYRQADTNPKRNFYSEKTQRNSSYKKLTPIASKSALPCCADSKKTAKWILEEMFRRLDDNTKKKICLEVHKVDENELMGLFDGHLSIWNDLGAQYPRLPLLYAICERLLMRTETMVKFFDEYKNGHNVLDRAVLTCSRFPLVARYLAECMIQTFAHLDKAKFSLEKVDKFGSSVLHRAASRGGECATALAGILSVNSSVHVPFQVDRLNGDGYSPLHIACSNHQIFEENGNQCSCHYMAHVLLKHGNADPNVKDGRSGNTPLHFAVDAPVCALNLVSLLTQHGAKCIKNYGGVTPLDFARTASRSKAHYPKRVIEILKKAK